MKRIQGGEWKKHIRNELQPAAAWIENTVFVICLWYVVAIQFTERSEKLWRSQFMMRYLRSKGHQFISEKMEGNKMKRPEGFASGLLMVGANGRWTIFTLTECRKVTLNSENTDSSFACSVMRRYMLKIKITKEKSLVVFMVGANGLEPLTPCTSSRCSSQLS